MGISKPSQGLAKHQKDMAVLSFSGETSKRYGCPIFFIFFYLFLSFSFAIFCRQGAEPPYRSAKSSGEVVYRGWLSEHSAGV
ncbi:hypothetical protein [Shewanella algae]|uniref:hypothetical protein n=1 Tax=Shewanella algae TaxID=38313 RepID=UPI0015878385|nr:hypothetical protein [Shewanella algae]